MTLSDFIDRYPARPPKKAPANEDENRRLGTADGVLHVAAPPLTSTFSLPPTNTNVEQGQHARHLWVFVQQTIPAILELAVVNPRLQSGKVKHSNLTGGAPASSWHRPQTTWAPSGAA